MRNLLLMLPGLVVGLTVHEYAHAMVARLLGDRYPESEGRCTLNPFAHLSPAGLLALFVLGFGWARPVTINPFNYRNPRRDVLLVSLAGPAVNIVLAGVAAVIAPLLTGRAFALVVATGIINVILALINLLPIPPLDGSQIWSSLFPNLKLARNQTVAVVVVIALIVALRSGAIDRPLAFAVDRYVALIEWLQLAMNR